MLNKNIDSIDDFFFLQCFYFQIKRIYYSHFIDYFHVDVMGGNLYLFYSDGEVQIYNEEHNEWRRGPTIDYNVLDVSMCMVAAKTDEKWIRA